MSLQSPSEQLVHLRDDVQLLIECTFDQEGQLEALVASAERDVRQAQAAVSDAANAEVDEVRRLLAAQLQRSAAGAATARRLCVDAHRQHTAARQLLEHLGAGQ